MRIVACIHALAGGGAERQMAGLANRLSARHDVTLITLADPSDADYPLEGAVRRVALGKTGQRGGRLAAPLRNVDRLVALRRAIRAARPDVVLSFCDTTNVLALAASRLLDVPVVVAERIDPRCQPVGLPWRLLRRHLYPRAAAVACVTESTRPVVERWARRPVVVIPPAVEFPPASRQRRPGGGSRLRLVSLGRLSWQKGFDRLIAAFGALAGEFPEWSLEIAGEGDCEAALRAQIADSPARDRVRLVGWRRDTWSFLAGGDAFALASRYEGLPGALLEAMAIGLPCVAVDCGSGPRDVIDHEANGLLATDGDADLVEQLRRLLGDAPLRRRLENRAPEVARRYRWERVVGEYERLLAGVVRQNERPSPPGNAEQARGETDAT